VSAFFKLSKFEIEKNQILNHHNHSAKMRLPHRAVLRLRERSLVVEDDGRKPTLVISRATANMMIVDETWDTGHQSAEEEEASTRHTAHCLIILHHCVF
jgi:hypothetical protein